MIEPTAPDRPIFEMVVTCTTCAVRWALDFDPPECTDPDHHHDLTYEPPEDSMPTRTFTVAQLDELDVTPYNCVADYPGYKGRWSTQHELVFEHEGKFWMVDYDEPATEMQDGQDRWPNGDSPEALVDAREVHQVPRIEMRWEPVDNADAPVDYAAAWVIDGLADSFHDLNDGEAPFGCYAQVESYNRGAIKITPDDDAENWDHIDPMDRLEEHRNLPEGTAPETPVVVVVAERIR